MSTIDLDNSLANPLVRYSKCNGFQKIFMSQKQISKASMEEGPISNTQLGRRKEIWTFEKNANNKGNTVIGQIAIIHQYFKIRIAWYDQITLNMNQKIMKIKSKAYYSE